MSFHAKRLVIFTVLILAITSADVSDATLRHIMNLRSNKVNFLSFSIFNYTIICHQNLIIVLYTMIRVCSL